MEVRTPIEERNDGSQQTSARSQRGNIKSLSASSSFPLQCIDTLLIVQANAAMFLELLSRQAYLNPILLSLEKHTKRGLDKAQDESFAPSL